MSAFRTYSPEGNPLGDPIRNHQDIARLLEAHGVQFQGWEAEGRLKPEADQDEVLAVYGNSIRRLNEKHGFRSVDLAALGPEHPQKKEMRVKFRDEHTHDDFAASLGDA